MGLKWLASCINPVLFTCTNGAITKPIHFAKVLPAPQTRVRGVLWRLTATSHPRHQQTAPQKRVEALVVKQRQPLRQRWGAARIMQYRSHRSVACRVQLNQGDGIMSRSLTISNRSNLTTETHLPSALAHRSSRGTGLRASAWLISCVRHVAAICFCLMRARLSGDSELAPATFTVLHGLDAEFLRFRAQRSRIFQRKYGIAAWERHRP